MFAWAQPWVTHPGSGLRASAFWSDSADARKLLLQRGPEALCSSVDWQEVIAILIVLTTAGLFIRTRWKRRAVQSHCGSHCGCVGASSTAPKVSVTYRARKGERPQIISRMT